MAFNYKSLAQVRPSAARPTEIINWVKNPSFEQRSIEGWRMTTDSRTSTPYMRFYLNEALLNNSTDAPEVYPATWGSDIAAQFSADDSRCVALYTGYDPFRGVNQGTLCPYPEDLVPVSAQMNYNYGYSLMRWSSNSSSNYRFRIHQWDEDYRFVTSNDLDFGADYANTGGTNKWQRVFSTLTTDGRTSYVSFAFYKTSADNVYHMFDDLYFGRYKEYAESPFNPDVPDMTYLAPFDKRRNGFLGDVNKSYTGRSFAGPQTLLYTVPASTSTMISSIVVTNAGEINSPYRLAILPSGVTIENLELDHFIAFDEHISPRQSRTLGQGLTLAAGDKVYAAADSGELNFNLFGAEIV
jgi:hypothetical protein